MADTVTSQTIQDGERLAILKFTNESDGTGEARPPAPREVRQQQRLIAVRRARDPQHGAANAEKSINQQLINPSIH